MDQTHQSPDYRDLMTLSRQHRTLRALAAVVAQDLGQAVPHAPCSGDLAFAEQAGMIARAGSTGRHYVTGTGLAWAVRTLGPIRPLIAAVDMAADLAAAEIAGPILEQGA